MLKFLNVALQRGSRTLFREASFTIPGGGKVGLTGANGAGKSSLFALILQELEPDLGDLELPSQWVIAHVAQETPAIDKPALDYVMDGDRELRNLQAQLRLAEQRQEGAKQALLHSRLEEVQGYSAKARAAKLMAGLGFSTDQETWPVLMFSGGWRMRLNLAQALMCRSDLLLLDEPTNHLDLDTVIWLQDWLSGYQGTLLLISHDREFLDNIADHILHFKADNLTLYPGNYSAFESIAAERLAQQQAQYKKQQREIIHIRRFVDRFRAQATKARQVQSRVKTLEKLELIAQAHVDSPFYFRFLSPRKASNPLLNCQDINVGYDDKEILKNLNLSVGPGDRIGLLGQNGSGKSTLIKVLASELKPFIGECQFSEGCRIGYFAQHQIEQLEGAESALYHLALIDADALEGDLRKFLGGFGFEGDKVLQRVDTFSGGEKSRLVLAMIIYQKPNLVLLDEPTNHLDLEMRHALSMALQDFEGAMVIVSHDRHLLRTTVDQFLLVADGGVSRFNGDLDDYRRWLSERNRSTESETAGDFKTPSTKDRRRLDAERRKQLKPFRSVLEKAEERIEALSSQNEALEKLLSDPGIYESPEKTRLKKLLLEKVHVDREIQVAESDWLAAGEDLEKAEMCLQ